MDAIISGSIAVSFDVEPMRALTPLQLQMLYLSAAERAMHLYLPEVCRHAGKPVWADQLIAVEPDDFGSQDTLRILLNCLDGARTPGFFETMLRACGMCVSLRNFLRLDTEDAQIVIIQSTVQISGFAGHAEYLRSGDTDKARKSVEKELGLQMRMVSSLLAQKQSHLA